MLRFLGFLFISLLLWSPAAASAAGPTGFYVAAEAVWDGVSYSGGNRVETLALAPNSLYGTNVSVGYQLFEGIGVEVGYLGLFGGGGLAGGIQSQGLTADAVLHVPINDWLDLDARGGVNWLATHAGNGDFFRLHSYSFGYRFGAGPEVLVATDLGWRTLVSYQQQGAGFTSGDVTVSSGLVWHL